MGNNLTAALKYLKDNRVKRGDSPESAARSERMNAITDAILSLARGDHMRKGPGIRLKTSEGSVIISGSSEEGVGGSVSNDTPFSVYESHDDGDPPVQVLKVFPGRIADIVPTLGGAQLDVSDDGAGPHPWFYSPTGNYTLFLKVVIDNTVPDSNFQSHVQSVSVLSDDDPLVTPDIDGVTGEIIELKMTWTGAPTEITDRVKGHFYIRIADIEAETIDTVVVVKTITQWLFNSYRTFVLAGDEVIILA